MLQHLGSIVVARARMILAASLVVLAVSIVLGIGVFGRLLSGGFNDPKSDSSRASDLNYSKFGGTPDLIFLIHARTGTVDNAAVASVGTALATRLSADERLTQVTSYWATKAPTLRSRDQTDALIVAEVIDSDQDATAVVSDYSNLDSPAATVRIGGASGTDIGGQVGKDLAVAEAIAVPITLILLVVAFGSLVSALLPLLVAVFAVFGAFAELDLLTHATSVSIFAINLVTALGLGLGIDYALFMVSRFREELTDGKSVDEAVVRTVSTAGRTIGFSALTVAVALSGLLVFPVYFLRSFAYAGIGVTIFAAASALTVLPAVLALLGHRVNAGRVPGIKAMRSVEAPFWGRLARRVMARPALTALPVVVLLLVLSSPLLGVTFGTPDDRVLPKSSATHQVGDALRTKFATAPDEIQILLSPGVSAEALTSYAQQLSSVSGVQSVSTATAAGAQRVSLTTALDSASSAAQALVHRVRAVAKPAGTTVLVGGASAELVDDKYAIGSHLVLAGLIVAIATLVLLFLFTGSVVQPVRALIGNALTLGATLGAAVWIFQDGHLSGVLGFTPTPTNTAMPVLLFCIAFGLSMDYEVFLMSRIKELHDEGSSNLDAVSHGLARTGRIVSTAAALLAVSFFAFGTSNVSFIQFFGLGTGLAILIDATLIRGILVPASIGALGDRSWWAPGLLQRFQRRFNFSDA